MTFDMSYLNGLLLPIAMGAGLMGYYGIAASAARLLFADKFAEAGDGGG